MEKQKSNLTVAPRSSYFVLVVPCADAVATNGTIGSCLPPGELHNRHLNWKFEAGHETAGRCGAGEMSCMTSFFFHHMQSEIRGRRRRFCTAIIIKSQYSRPEDENITLKQYCITGLCIFGH